MTQKEQKLFHYLEITFYLIFLPLIMFIIPVDRYVDKDPLFLIYLFVYLVMIHFVNRKFNLATAIINHQYVRATSSLLALLAITALITVLGTNVLDINNSQNIQVTHMFEVRFRSILTLLVIDVSFNSMLGLVYELFKQKSYRQEIENQKNIAEISLYKSQINPHFMFNTLNTLYGLYITQSEKTGASFLKFTDMIKYMFTNTEKEKVSIEDEINYLKEYIDLQQLRLCELTTIHFDCDIDDETQQIPPMLLIPFVENTFKYGVSSTHESLIDIRISLKNRKFSFAASNSIFMRNQVSNGIGIYNCRKRLELLYPNQFTLVCKEENEHFNTLLKIQL